MDMMSIISKVYCSSSQTVLMVRRRPHVVNGGGFVVTDCSTQRVVFKVDGCGILGTKGELILRDGDGEALLLMRRKRAQVKELIPDILGEESSTKRFMDHEFLWRVLELLGRDSQLASMGTEGGMVEALGIYKKWKGYSLDYEGSQNLVFRLKEPYSCLVKNKGIIISTEPKATSNKGCDFEIRGYFPDKSCSIVDTGGNVVAQVEVNEEVKKLTEIKDLYHVVVKPGIDQAFVLGVIAILDYIYGESTYC